MRDLADTMMDHWQDMPVQFTNEHGNEHGFMWVLKSSMSPCSVNVSPVGLSWTYHVRSRKKKKRALIVSAQGKVADAGGKDQTAACVRICIFKKQPGLPDARSEAAYVVLYCASGFQAGSLLHVNDPPCRPVEAVTARRSPTQSAQ